ncbi:hypothetical protein D3C77_297720 [compost metagenome]
MQPSWFTPIYRPIRHCFGACLVLSSCYLRWLREKSASAFMMVIRCSDVFTENNPTLHASREGSHANSDRGSGGGVAGGVRV